MININEYQRYIESIVKKIVYMFPDAQLSAEDLRQRGWLELIEAKGRYDTEKGVKFTTFAYKAVETGIRKEAIFQINRSGVNSKNFIALTESLSFDEEGNIAQKISADEFLTSDAEDEGGESEEWLQGALQLLSELEREALFMSFGIECERCASAKKIAKKLDVSELEVKRALASGKRKLEELSDGRKQSGTGA